MARAANNYPECAGRSMIALIYIFKDKYVSQVLHENVKICIDMISLLTKYGSTGWTWYSLDIKYDNTYCFDTLKIIFLAKLSL